MNCKEHDIVKVAWIFQYITRESDESTSFSFSLDALLLFTWAEKMDPCDSLQNRYTSLELRRGYDPFWNLK